MGVTCVSLQLVYHSLQLLAFAILAILIMRLKLFLTPHMCIMASLVCSRQVRLAAAEQEDDGETRVRSERRLSGAPILCLSQLFGWIGDRLKHQMAVFVLLALMAIQGVANLHAQWAIIGEFSNLPQEELLDWIQENAEPSESPPIVRVTENWELNLQTQLHLTTSRKYFHRRSRRSA